MAANGGAYPRDLVIGTPSHAHAPLEKAGVLDKLFEALQRRVLRIRIEAVSPDSTRIKVHPDGTGALKNRSSVHRQISGRMEHQIHLLPRILERP
jgi:hypothetical protein